MTDTIQIDTGERGIVRVFGAVGSAAAMRGHAALVAALGLPDDADTGRIDVLDPADMGDMSLPRYLETAYDIPPDAAGLADLAKAAGTILVVPSRAFGGQPAVLRPATGVHLLARLTEADAPVAAIEPLRSASAEGLLTGAPPVDRSRANRKASGYAAMAALAVALLIAFVVWLVAA